MTTLAQSSIKQLSALLFLMTTGIGTLFLFYIDEGNYNLNNLFTQHNLIALSFYFIGIYFAQMALFWAFKKYQNLYKSLVWSILLGFPLGAFLTAGIILGLGFLIKG